MKPIGIFYATREGQTREIAEYLSNHLRWRGFEVESHDVRSNTGAAPAGYAALILAASVHGGKHEPEMIRFVKDHLAELNCLPAAFLSVSLSEASAELRTATPEQRASGAAGVQQVLEKFYANTGWRPKHVMPVAGALLYSKYNFVVRFVMKRSAKRSGGATDTSKDYIYTDWAALERFVNDFVDGVAAAPPPERSSALP